jgi:hypothetical protein
VRRTLVVVPRCALTVCFSHIAQSASEWLGGVIWNRRARTHVLFYLSLSLSLSAAKCECDAVCSGGGDAKFTPGSTNWERVQIWHVRIYVWETPLFYSSGRQEKVHGVFSIYSIDEKDLRLQFFNLIIAFGKLTITDFSYQTQSGAFKNMVVIESLFRNFVAKLFINQILSGVHGKKNAFSLKIGKTL